MAELASIRSAQRVALITQQVSTVVPLQALPVTTAATSGLFTASAFGLWTTVQSSGTLTGHALTMACVAMSNLSDNYQVQLGTGAAGSETVVADFAYASGSATVPTLYEPFIPAVSVPTNERVAVRFAATSTTHTLSVYLAAVPRPF